MPGFPILVSTEGALCYLLERYGRKEKGMADWITEEQALTLETLRLFAGSGSWQKPANDGRIIAGQGSGRAVMIEADGRARPATPEERRDWG